MIRYSCPHCNERLQVDESRAGKAFVCSLCGKTTLVPSGSNKPALPVRQAQQPPQVQQPQQATYAQPEVLPPPSYQQGPYHQQQPTVVVIQQPMQAAPQQDPQLAPSVAKKAAAAANAAHPLATGLLMLWIASGLIGMVIGVFAWLAELGSAIDSAGGAGMLGASLGMGLLGMLSGGIWLLIGIPVVVFFMASRKSS